MTEYLILFHKMQIIHEMNFRLWWYYYSNVCTPRCSDNEYRILCNSSFKFRLHSKMMHLERLAYCIIIDNVPLESRGCGFRPPLLVTQILVPRPIWFFKWAPVFQMGLNGLGIRLESWMKVATSILKSQSLTILLKINLSMSELSLKLSREKLSSWISRFCIAICKISLWNWGCGIGGNTSEQFMQVSRYMVTQATQEYHFYSDVA